MKVLCVLVAVVAVACAGTIKGNQANNGVNEGGLHNEGPEEAAPATSAAAKPGASGAVSKPGASVAVVATPGAAMVSTPGAALVAGPAASLPLPAGKPGKGKFSPDKFLANLANANAAVLNANSKIPSVLAAKAALDAIPPKEPLPADHAALVEGSVALDKAPVPEVGAALDKAPLPEGGVASDKAPLPEAGSAAPLPDKKPSSGSGGVIAGSQANNGVNEGGLHNEDKPAAEAAPAVEAPAAAPEAAKPAPEAAKPSSGGTIGGNQANNGVNEGGLHN